MPTFSNLTNISLVKVTNIKEHFYDFFICDILARLITFEILLFDVLICFKHGFICSG